MGSPGHQFSVVDEMPDSVQALADRPGASTRSAGPANVGGPPAGARAAKLPAELQPQLATLLDEAPHDAAGWLDEIKFDGYRMLARVEHGKVQLVTRNGNDWTRKLTGLAQALQAMDLPDGWYDGEIVLPGADAAADFQALQGAFDTARLRYAGNVGTGFDEAVCEVSFGEWTRDDRIRHSVFHGLRADKPPNAVTREQAVHEAPAGRPAAGVALPGSLRVSHPERVVDAQSGITKIDLVRYYALVAPLMMEHLKRRPIALLRAPEGIAGELFFQKHLERYKMPGVVQLDPAIFPGHPSMLEIEKPEGLLSAAQMNVVEIHTWNGTVPQIAKPDRTTFDIDPGEGVKWAQIQEAAQLVRIDYLRNGYGATTACAWSARARPGLGISVPVGWDELGKLKGGAHWTVATVRTRLDQGNAPGRDYESSRAPLAAAMKKLGFQR